MRATTDQNQHNNIDRDGNEINLWGKIISGILLIGLTIFSLMAIIAYWPDRLPTPEEKFAPLYVHEIFHIRLACISDTVCCVNCIVDNKTATNTASLQPASDSSSTGIIDSAINADSIYKKEALQTPGISNVKSRNYIHINTLLLLLVALGGFLGNMIHIATSFTTFVGAGKFKRSWLLWYCLKPFTASALAISIYFIFRAGFLNMSDGAQSINLYGLMTISILAGLFTDKATEKLKELVEVLFKSKEVRPDPLVTSFKITGITPSNIEKGKENKLTLTGEDLDKQKLVISINDEKVTGLLFTSTTIIITYTIPESQKDKTKFRVSVKDEKGKEHFTADLELKE